MNRLELELVGRDDVDNGKPWKVFDARPERGSPSTNVEHREIHIPKGDNDLEECIRIHEMIHAKISPTSNDFAGWLSRGVASKAALMLAEETRVNYLATLLGYPFEISLADKRERKQAELFALRGDWSGLVSGTIASVFTAAEKDWIKGSRKHSPIYAKQLTTMVNLIREYWLSFDNKFQSKDVMKELSKIDSLALSRKTKINNREIINKRSSAINTEGEPAYRSPNIGFGYSEELAEMIDIFLDAKDYVSEADEDDEIFHSATQTTIVRSIYGTKSLWDVLRLSPIRPSKKIHGSLNRKHTGVQYGKNPRFMSRLLTDPERRIFNRVQKVKGGFVLIDGSGSMQFKLKEIEQIVLACPGATIAVYSASDSPSGHGKEHCPFNIFLLAKNDKMVTNKQLSDVVTSLNGGNGVDLPALQWILKLRKNKKQFVIWVTDGYVHQIPSEVTKVINLAVLNKIMFAANMSEALNLINLLKKQSWVKTILPPGMLNGIAMTYGIKGSTAEITRRVAKKLHDSIKLEK